ncbi:MAG: hypothetical protein A3I29_00190 [Candidatus Magasanikbacteria bacterium RIFCSPLOWO2_02_FULL_44_11]|uniref:Uncharacterized protein n=2 Tax=Candidatus Magasanikiibacteriota TaxID=1752731 RepID=A0A1F6NB86_9BACT|nr:MAG: hypothetical protein A3D53_01940 [Candidatus Magasanikbacteria bacterium RIFCSPHIGHO2_02_FULL_45_10]OGH80983.1 MAG: hypothetical protein A3I29_00190 [Candidatus Magasanikbacteria bacterium RIFCSPLOWO2_02_FULL_44_11]
MQFCLIGKKAGEFIKLKKQLGKCDEKSSFTEADVNDVMNCLNGLKDRIDLAKEIFLENEKKDEIIFEFWYRNGKIVFTDIDG